MVKHIGTSIHLDCWHRSGSMLPESSRIAILEILLTPKTALEVSVELRLGGLLVGELVADRLQLLRFLQCED